MISFYECETYFVIPTKGHETGILYIFLDMIDAALMKARVHCNAQAVWAFIVQDDVMRVAQARDDDALWFKEKSMGKDQR